jgi:hypothetical protein
LLSSSYSISDKSIFIQSKSLILLNDFKVNPKSVNHPSFIPASNLSWSVGFINLLSSNLALVISASFIIVFNHSIYFFNPGIFFLFFIRRSAASNKSSTLSIFINLSAILFLSRGMLILLLSSEILSSFITKSLSGHDLFILILSHLILSTLIQLVFFHSLFSIR